MDGEDGLPPVVTEAGDVAPVTPKKRTRRGSRGGRNRRRPAAATAPADGDDLRPSRRHPKRKDPASEEQPLPGPVIHVPGRELGSDGGETSKDGEGPTPERKPTRRGSRGGRNRRQEARRRDRDGRGAGDPGGAVVGKRLGAKARGSNVNGAKVRVSGCVGIHADERVGREVTATLRPLSRALALASRGSLRITEPD